MFKGMEDFLFSGDENRVASQMLEKELQEQEIELSLETRIEQADPEEIGRILEFISARTWF
jgi:hypothetical protein